jgi:transcriptional regulator with XRE-family HTH domain
VRVARQETPLPPGPLGDFGRDLRDLRIAAGMPSYRELARRARYSASALSAAASGKLLPTLEVTLAYAAAR